VVPKIRGRVRELKVSDGKFGRFSYKH
jgi:hypothetical protein